jgi:hypothetical protein
MTAREGGQHWQKGGVQARGALVRQLGKTRPPGVQLVRTVVMHSVLAVGSRMSRGRRMVGLASEGEVVVSAGEAQG